MIKAVIDINVLLSSISRSSKTRAIFDSIRFGKLHLCVSNEIIDEYFEILENKTSFNVAKNITNLILSLGNTKFINIYFAWDLVTFDPDDSKYVDCYLNANADYLVTNDKHFNELKEIKFPQVNVINSDDFLEFLKN